MVKEHQVNNVRPLVSGCFQRSKPYPPNHCALGFGRDTMVFSQANRTCSGSQCGFRCLEISIERGCEFDHISLVRAKGICRLWPSWPPLVSCVRPWGFCGLGTCPRSQFLGLGILHQETWWFRGWLRLVGVGFGGLARVWACWLGSWFTMT